MSSKAVTVGGEAVTATAGPTEPGGGPPLAEVEIGRYRIEQVLGAGGMGTVYAAFDPELERRVALKVLSGDRRGDSVGRERLLREARAMARLNHPNVITVFEVGSAGGHDYVAMEMVDGSNLADWLRHERPSPREIVAAFVQAGAGIVAAHAIGLIHRDFKPHNVLRWRDGSVEVSDFGLAREAGAQPPEEQPPARNTPTPLAGLTMTGAIVGTPAYMAPEQWEGGSVGEAADQFAFCVALWEALAGERPFRGEAQEIHAAMLRGPAELDDTRIPRALRDLLRRGLDPDPAKRWPAMTDVLGRLASYLRRRSLVIGLSGAIIATVAAIGFVLARGPADSCAPPLLDVDHAWSPARRADLLAKHQEPAVRSIDRDLRTWSDVRGRACKLEPALRVPALACLDGVMGRIDGAADAVAHVAEPSADIDLTLVDPHVCDQPTPPRLVPRIGPGFRAVLARGWGEETNREPLTQAVIDRLVLGAGDDPCGGALADLYGLRIVDSLSEGRPLLARAANLAEACNDDYLRFVVTFSAATWEFRQPQSDEALRALELLDAAARRLGERQAVGDVEQFKAARAIAEGRADDALAHYESALGSYRARGVVGRYLTAAQHVFQVRTLRARPEDVTAATALLDQMRAVAGEGRAPDDPMVRSVEYLRASWLHANGDVAAADAIYERLRKPGLVPDPIAVHGRVVDASGAPVVGAIVTTSCCLAGDALHAAVPESDNIGSRMRSAVTDGEGRFVLPDSATEGDIIAQLDHRRSRPRPVADGIDIVLEDTTRIEGHVVLHGTPAFDVRVTAHDMSLLATQPYLVGATVRPDGSFVLEGVPRGKVVVLVAVEGIGATRSTGMPLEVGTAPITGLELALPEAQRAIPVLIRSTAGEGIPRAWVWAVSGKEESCSLESFEKEQTATASAVAANAGPLGDHAPAAVRARSRPGDLFATAHADRGETSICVVGLPSDDSRAMDVKMSTHAAEVPVVCVPAGAGEEVVVVEVAPFPRLD